MVERARIVYTPSLAVLGHLMERNRTEVSRGSVVAFSDPAVAAAGIPPLPHAAKEMASLEKAFGTGRMIPITRR